MVRIPGLHGVWLQSKRLKVGVLRALYRSVQLSALCDGSDVRRVSAGLLQPHHGRGLSGLRMSPLRIHPPPVRPQWTVLLQIIRQWEEVRSVRGEAQSISSTHRIDGGALFSSDRVSWKEASHSHANLPLCVICGIATKWHQSGHNIYFHCTLPYRSHVLIAIFRSVVLINLQRHHLTWNSSRPYSKLVPEEFQAVNDFNKWKLTLSTSTLRLGR